MDLIKNPYNAHQNEENDKPIKLSTITATGCIGCFIMLNNVYRHIVIDDVHDTSIKRDGFTYIEWGEKNNLTHIKGFHKKLLVNHKTRQEGKRFDKQITVILRKYNAATDTYLYQNLKIFFNGNVQMTGLKSIEQGVWVLEYLIRTFTEMHDKHPPIITDTASFGEDALKVHDYNIQLINTDFHLGYTVNRRALDSLIDKYGFYHVFEAGNYPGVKISFFWNEGKTRQDGICRCQNNNECKNAKSKKNEHLCKKITVIVFQSGSVIITGAQTYQQIEDTYKTMIRIFDEIQEKIKKQHGIAVQTHVKKYAKFSYNDLNRLRINKKIIIPKGYVYDTKSTCDS